MTFSPPNSHASGSSLLHTYRNATQTELVPQDMSHLWAMLIRRGHVLHFAKTRSRDALLMCARGVMQQGKDNRWLGKGSIRVRIESYVSATTHRVSPLVYFASNAISFPFESLERLKSSVASIVAIAHQTDASPAWRPDADQYYAHDRRINLWYTVTYLDILSSQSQKRSRLCRQLAYPLCLKISQG